MKLDALLFPTDERNCSELVRQANETARTNRWEVRQMVRTGDRLLNETVYSSESERMARCSFKSLVRDNPRSNFELVEVRHSERCVWFYSSPYI